MMCPECEQRPVHPHTRGRCRACYQRHQSQGTLANLPRSSYYKHTARDCTICDEVTSLTAYGWDAATILAAINRNAEYVLRHLRQFDHPKAHLFVPFATESAREREHRRKATA